MKENQTQCGACDLIGDLVVVEADPERAILSQEHPRNQKEKPRRDSHEATESTEQSPCTENDTDDHREDRQFHKDRKLFEIW